MSEKASGMKAGMSSDYHYRVARLESENAELKKRIEELEGALCGAMEIVDEFIAEKRANTRGPAPGDLQIQKEGHAALAKDGGGE